MLSFVLTGEVLDQKMDFFASHNIEAIPPYLLKRLNEIADSAIIKPDLVDFFEINKDFVEKAHISSSLSFIFAFYHPTFPTFLARFAEVANNISIIINNELYDKFKRELYEEFKHFLAFENVEFYLYHGEVELTCLSICDQNFVLRLVSKDNKYSNNYLFCSDPEAYQWSRDLFNHYLKDAFLITDI